MFTPSHRHAFALVLVSLAGAAHAGLVNNTGAAVRANADNGWSDRVPANPLFMPAGSCAWLTPGLDSLGYREIRPGIDDPATIGDGRWTINRRTLNGNLVLDTYKAFVNSAPVVTVDDFTKYTVTDVTGLGGAAFGMRYTPGAGDPTTGLHWLQVIRTNWGINDNAVGNYSIYMDNPQSVGTPFYDAPAAGNPTGTRTNNDGSFRDFWLVDRPRRDLVNGVDWQAQTFIATWNQATETINIYDGVWWGYNLGANAAPTPGSISLLALSGVVACRRRRGR